jgi:hypothetical protein
MDVSKLPRLSKTDPPPPAAPASPPSSPADGRERVIVEYRVVHDALPAGPEAWISGIAALLLLLLFPRMLQFVFHKLFGSAFTWTFTDPQGGPLTYTQTIFFWGDLVITVFAIVLLLDAIVLLWGRSKIVVAGALALTVAATLGNLVYLLATFNQGVAIMSAVAVAYGGFIIIHEWRLLKWLNRSAEHSQPSGGAGGFPSA